MRTSDLTSGLKLVGRLVLPINPVPASRPRVTRWGTYYSKPYKKWMAVAASVIGPGPGIDDPKVVIVNLVIDKPRTSKLERPRGDIDNYVKSVFDAMTKAGGWWPDDEDILALVATKRFTKADERGHADVLIYS